MHQHDHPATRWPITWGRLESELFGLWAISGLAGQPSLVHLPELDHVHAQDSRRYAQVAPATGRVEVAEAALWLPPEHRLGLLAHEIGHCLAPEAGEDGADLAAAAVLGVLIDYDHRWPGKGLQVARA